MKPLKTIRKFYRKSVKVREVTISSQATRGNSAHKVALIEPVIKNLNCHSVLDIGCNAGEVTRMLGKNCFAVGIDQILDCRGFEDPHKGACLGEMVVDNGLIEKLPRFDAILLLSVHHQWVRKLGEETAVSMLHNLANKTNKVIFMEFAALGSKFGSEEIFEDNDESTIVAYAQKWLDGTFHGFDSTYLGHAPHRPGKLAYAKEEPERYMFSCIRNAAANHVIERS